MRYFCGPGAFSQVVSRAGSKDTVMAEPDSSAIVQHPSYRRGPHRWGPERVPLTSHSGDLNPG